MINLNGKSETSVEKFLLGVVLHETPTSLGKRNAGKRNAGKRCYPDSFPGKNSRVHVRVVR